MTSATKNLIGILRHQARDGNVFDHSNDTVVVTRSLLKHAADLIERQHAKRLDLDRRIHNQRVNLRQTWEIVEMRAGYKALPTAVRSRMLEAWCRTARLNGQSTREDSDANNR